MEKSRSAKNLHVMKDALVSAAASLREDIDRSERKFKSMPELSFNVTKTMNAWPHKKVPRILQLTESGISNIRPGDSNTRKPSSFYSYDRVIKVVMTDLRTFVIEYKGSYHSYMYSSPIALQIVQEIEARQKLLDTSRKWRETLRLQQQFIYKFNEPSSKSQSAAIKIANQGSEGSTTALQTRSLTESSSATRERSLSSLLLEGTVAPHGTPETPPWSSKSPRLDAASPANIRLSGQLTCSSESPATIDITEGRLFEPCSSRPGRRVRLSTLSTHRAKKMSTMLGDDDSSRIDAAVLVVLKDPVNEEARVLKHFIDNFSLLERNPITMMMNIRGFMDQLKFRLLTPESRTKYLFDKLVLQSNNKEQLEAFVETSVERIVLGPVFERVMSPLLRSNASVDRALTIVMDKWKTRSQLDTHISPKYVSETEFQFAILELKEITRCMLPTEKLHAVIKCMNAIVDTIKSETDDSSPVLDIGADDLLPILIFVVVQSGIYTIDSQCQYMWALGSPEDLRGEQGYYLTMLNSAVDFLKDATSK